MPQRNIYSCIGALLLFILPAISASANIVITGTRVIYPAQEKEVTVQIDNLGDKPVLAQSWIDDGNPDITPEMAKAPFTLTPPVNRLNAGKGQMLRLMFTGADLPANKESIFWLNVLGIPALDKGKQHQLQMAFRSRIKIFYRPKGLTGEANKAGESIVWKRTKEGMEGYNPTPYFVSIAKINGDKEGNKSIAEGGMIPPGGRATFAASNNKINIIHPVYIDDYGGTRAVPQTLAP